MECIANAPRIYFSLEYIQTYRKVTMVEVQGNINFHYVFVLIGLRFNVNCKLSSSKLEVP